MKPLLSLTLFGAENLCSQTAKCSSYAPFLLSNEQIYLSINHVPMLHHDLLLIKWIRFLFFMYNCIINQQLNGILKEVKFS